MPSRDKKSPKGFYGQISHLRGYCVSNRSSKMSSAPRILGETLLSKEDLYRFSKALEAS